MNHTFKNWGNKELCKEEKARLFGNAEDTDKKYLEYLLEELNSIVEKTNTTGVIG